MQMAFIVEARISRKFIIQNVHNGRDSISIRATTRKKSDCFHCHILKRFYFSLLLSQKLRWQYNVFFLVRNYIRNFNSRVPKKDWISFWIYAFKYIFPLKFISACSPLLLLSTKKQNYRNAKKISIARREECPLNSMTIHKYLMIFFSRSDRWPTERIKHTHSTHRRQWPQLEIQHSH